MFRSPKIMKLNVASWLGSRRELLNAVKASGAEILFLQLVFSSWPRRQAKPITCDVFRLEISVLFVVHIFEAMPCSGADGLHVYLLVIR